MPNPTPADRPADQLRAAARKLRAAALAATAGPWAAEPGTIPHGHRVGTADASDWVAWTGAVTEEKSEADAAYIALMHPGVGLALATWLESTARTVDAVSEKYEPDPAAQWLAPALAVARQLLGTTEGAGAAAEEQEPIQLRWGLDDVMYGDDDTTTVLLSGPGREPYWVELDPERTAALRDALAGPEAAAPPAPADRAAILNEVADEIAGIDFHPNARARSIDIATGLVHRIRRLAGEAAAGVQQTTKGDCPACDAGIEHAVHCPTPETHNAGCGCPSDVAAAYASCPGYEMSPSPCRCPCYGCKHHCSAHQPAAPAVPEERP
ncbi:hypothetical protein [Streptomyces sp. DT117]|uniref:hypothetical protein n=1 Tax=Streptomyces sp. DT117 TaxID=3393422 RepID=UPI003CEB4C05